MRIVKPTHRGTPAKRFVNNDDRREINKLAKGLDTVLKRCDPKLTPIKRRLVVAMSKEAMLRYLQGYNEIYPSNEKMAVWADCSVKTVQRHIEEFENWGFVVSLDEKMGGNSTTNRYWIDLFQITQITITLNGNPKNNFLANLRDYQSPLQGRQKGRQEGRQMSYGYIGNSGNSDRPDLHVVTVSDE